jgi:hypothetical protein
MAKVTAKVTATARLAAVAHQSGLQNEKALHLATKKHKKHK